MSSSLCFKRSLLAKKIWIPCMGSKVPFWQFFNSGKMELLSPCMELKKNWPKDFFWSIMKITFTQNIPNMSHFPPNPGYRLPVYDFLPYRHVAWKWETFVPYKTGSQCDQPFHFISLNTRSLIVYIGAAQYVGSKFGNSWSYLQHHFKKYFVLNTSLKKQIDVDCFWQHSTGLKR